MGKKKKEDQIQKTLESHISLENQDDEEEMLDLHGTIMKEIENIDNQFIFPDITMRVPIDGNELISMFGKLPGEFIFPVFSYLFIINWILCIPYDISAPTLNFVKCIKQEPINFYMRLVAELLGKVYINESELHYQLKPNEMVQCDEKSGFVISENQNSSFIESKERWIYFNKKPINSSFVYDIQLPNEITENDFKVKDLDIFATAQKNAITELFYEFEEKKLKKIDKKIDDAYENLSFKMASKINMAALQFYFAFRVFTKYARITAEQKKTLNKMAWKAIMEKKPVISTLDMQFEEALEEIKKLQFDSEIILEGKPTSLQALEESNYLGFRHIDEFNVACLCFRNEKFQNYIGKRFGFDKKCIKIFYEFLKGDDILQTGSIDLTKPVTIDKKSVRFLCFKI